MLRESRSWKIERRNAQREESTKLDRRNGSREGNPEKLQEKQRVSPLQGEGRNVKRKETQKSLRKEN